MLGIHTCIQIYIHAHRYTYMHTCHKKFRGLEFEEEDRGRDMKEAGGENGK